LPDQIRDAYLLPSPLAGEGLGMRGVNANTRETLYFTILT